MKKNKLWLTAPVLICLLAFAGMVQAQRADDKMRVGQISLLHKVTAKIQPLDLRLDTPVEVGDLTITMHDCISAPPEEPPETKVFLKVVETQADLDVVVFNGWMFASSPSIHALEHPVYDLWPKGCVTENGRTYIGPAR